MNYYILLGIAVWAYMTLWFVVSLYRKRNDVADIAWGLGFVMLAWASLLISQHIDIRGIVVCALVTIWGVRLSSHIYRRNRGKPEDYRYAKWREEWKGLFYVRSYIQVYILQGVLLFLVSLPVLLINEHGNQSFGILDLIGVCLWCIGFFFEFVGDAQLETFIKNPANKGKIMQDGLWRYTRHPNYFGEVTQWWGIWVIALGVSHGWIGVIGPLTITVLILYVSGIPLLERKLAEKPEYVQYKKHTSKFFPLPPRNIS